MTIPPEVLWPYVAGGAALAVGLLCLPQAEKRARGFERLIRFGPVLVAMAMAVFGADHLTQAKFVATVVPAFLPWRLFWAYWVGFCLLAAALSLATTVWSRLAAALLGAMIFSFVLLIHIPNWVQAPHDNFRLTLLLRDLTLSAGIFAYGAGRPRVTAVARFLVATPMAVFGVDHVLKPAFAPGIPPDDPSLSITLPGWIPAHAAWGYLTGAIFLACAVGLASGPYARSAAKALGGTVLAVILVVYIPLTIAKASDVSNGLNYLAIHCALAGAALLLAAAISQPRQETA